jgi:predicted  nucleic acid-binding Zn-ribbon protein
MSHDFIQNAVNALYQSNELMALKGELANLKAERDQLKADLEKSDGVVWTLSVENERLKAEVERLRKAGDAMANLLSCAGSPPNVVQSWNAAKDGKPSE